MTIVNHYVKFGIAGYGPDLTEEDVAYDDVASLCQAIRWDLDHAIDVLAEEWGIAKEQDDAEAYMAARELADELETLRANLDYEKRMEAPLYVGRRDVLDESMLLIIEENFPVDVGRYSRLYVWEATD